MTTEEAAEFSAGYDPSVFPAGLTERYEPLECFSRNELWETLLVEGKADGALYVCKSYNKDAFLHPGAEGDILEAIGGQAGFPAYAGRFEDDKAVYILRQYLEGERLDAYAAEKKPSEDGVIVLTAKLCGLLSFLHGLVPPVIHRDVKPSNIIVDGEGEPSLIDFGIARRYDERADSDTVCYATRAYAPPEQYGFAQTDGRTDIFSCGRVLRFLLTGRPEGEIKNRRLERIAARCTQLAPEHRYPNAEALRRALLRARPGAVKRRRIAAAVLALVLLVGGAAGGAAIYKNAHKPFDFSSLDTPGYMTDGAETAEAVAYMKEKYGTALFDDADQYVTVGLLKQALIEVYGLDAAYVNAKPEDFGDSMPMESENYFLPWGYPDEQALESASDILIYSAIKALRPDIVADWSPLTDDTGEYPGVRVALLYADEHGISDGFTASTFCGMDELALIFMRTEKALEG